jgi:hypothetical protein
MDKRRNATKGQLATAMRYPYGQQGRGKNAAARKAYISNGFSALNVLKLACTVLHHSRPLAESVVKGITPLDAVAIAPDAPGAFAGTWGGRFPTFAIRRTLSRPMLQALNRDAERKVGDNLPAAYLVPVLVCDAVLPVVCVPVLD